MMKVILIALLFAVAACDTYKHYHYNGTMARASAEQTIFGAIFVEFLKNTNASYIAGMSVSKTRVHTPFELAGKFAKVEVKSDNSFVINVTINEAKWDNKKFAAQGNMIIVGTWDKATVDAYVVDTKTQMVYKLHAQAIRSPCGYYSMPEAATRAGFLVGEKARLYKAANVLNHALWGYAFIHTFNCKYYLEKFGTVTNETKPGALIVGKDGKHCAVVDKEGDKFIQSHTTKDKVMLTPMTMLKTFFPQGYVLKEYDCKVHLY